MSSEVPSDLSGSKATALAAEVSTVTVCAKVAEANPLNRTNRESILQEVCMTPQSVLVRFNYGKTMILAVPTLRWNSGAAKRESRRSTRVAVGKLKEMRFLATLGMTRFAKEF